MIATQFLALFSSSVRPSMYFLWIVQQALLQKGVPAFPVQESYCPGVIRSSNFRYCAPLESEGIASVNRYVNALCSPTHTGRTFPPKELASTTPPETGQIYFIALSPYRRI
jgi:hypothetical protein